MSDEKPAPQEDNAPIQDKVENFVRCDGDLRLALSNGLGTYIATIQKQNATAGEERMKPDIRTTVGRLQRLQDFVEDGFEGLTVRQAKFLGKHKFVIVFSPDEAIDPGNDGYVNIDQLRKGPVHEVQLVLSETAGLSEGARRGEMGGSVHDIETVLASRGYQIEIMANRVALENGESHPEVRFRSMDGLSLRFSQEGGCRGVGRKYTGNMTYSSDSPFELHLSPQVTKGIAAGIKALNLF